jgi:hypothetical protein
MARGRSSGSRITYLLAVVASAGLLYVVDRSPGWEHLGILTPAAAPIVPWVNALLVVTLASSIILLFVDSPGLRNLAVIAVSALAIWAAFRLLTVFPFDYDQVSGQGTVIRVVLAAIMIGGILAIVVTFAHLRRSDA